MYSYLPLIVANHVGYDVNHSLDGSLASSDSNFLFMSSAAQPAL